MRKHLTLFLVGTFLFALTLVLNGCNAGSILSSERTYRLRVNCLHGKETIRATLESSLGDKAELQRNASFSDSPEDYAFMASSFTAVFTGKPGDTVTFTARVPKQFLTAKEPYTLTDDTNAEVKLRLQPETGNHISGTVVTPNGKPVGGLSVLGYLRDSTVTTSTKSDGTFVLEVNGGKDQPFSGYVQRPRDGATIQWTHPAGAEPLNVIWNR